MSNKQLENIFAQENAEREAKRQADEERSDRQKAFAGPLSMLTADRKHCEKIYGVMTDEAYCDALASAYVSFGAALLQFGEVWKLDRVSPSSNVTEEAKEAYREQIRLIELSIKGKHEAIRRSLQLIFENRKTSHDGFAWWFFYWMDRAEFGPFREILNVVEPQPKRRRRK